MNKLALVILVILIFLYNVFIYLISNDYFKSASYSSESTPNKFKFKQIDSSDNVNETLEESKPDSSIESSGEIQNHSFFDSQDSDDSLNNDQKSIVYRSELESTKSSPFSEVEESDSFLYTKSTDLDSSVSTDLFSQTESESNKNSIVSEFIVGSKNDKDDIDSFLSDISINSQGLLDSELISSYLSSEKTSSDTHESSLSDLSSQVSIDDASQSPIASDSATDDFLESLSEPVCSFPPYNFTVDEIQSIWNYFNYTNCKTNSNDSISIERDKFIAKCGSNLPPKYFNDPLRPEKLGGSSKIFASWSSISPDLSKSSFAFVKCQEGSTYAFTFLRHNKSISEKALKISSDLQKSSNFSAFSNLKVLFLVFDSVSRGSSYRNWPKTVNYLKSLNSTSFEFSNPGVAEIHTQDNMAQILYGETLKKMQKTLGTRNPPMTVSSKIHLDYQKKAIWKYFSNQGFVTLFLHDTVWDFLSLLTGHDIETDHFLGNFWRAAWSVYGFHEYENKQRCMGLENSHNKSFAHTLKFFEQYPDNHQFAYVHLNAAHERSGNVRTVDSDLKDFLKSLTELFDKRQEDFVVFLVGDHGSAVEKIQFDVRGFYESRQPMHFLVLSPGLINQRIRENLNHNEIQLFSRFDLHLTLKEIAHLPYGGMNEEKYQTLKSSFEVSDVASLFREKLSQNRTCGDIGVMDEFCPCTGFQDVDNDNQVEMLIRGNVIWLIREFFQNRRKENSACLDSLFDVTEYKKLSLGLKQDGWEALHKVKIQTQGMNAVFEVRSCTEKRIRETKSILNPNYFTSKNYSIEGTSVFFQVSHVEVYASCSSYCFC